MSPAPPKRFEVLGLGCTTVDDLVYVPSFPPADAKVRVERTLRRCGGLTATALVAAARLGARCAYAGCLGTDPLSQHVAAHFTAEGVDLSLAPRLPEARTVHSTIVVGRDTGSRNIFYEVEGLMGAHPTLPSEQALRDTAVLFIDHYGMEGNLRAAQIARAAQVAVVADLEDEAVPLFRQVLELVDHLILSEDFALHLTRAPHPAAAARALWRADRAVVIVTCGASGCWSVSKDGGLEPRHHPTFPVKALDTTGCGDVFHGAYAAALARGGPLDARIRFASAAAALKAAQSDLPDFQTVREFLGRPAQDHEEQNHERQKHVSPTAA